MVCRRQLIRILGFNIVQELSKIWSKIKDHSPLYIVQWVLATQFLKIYGPYNKPLEGHFWIKLNLIISDTTYLSCSKTNWAAKRGSILRQHMMLKLKVCFPLSMFCYGSQTVHMTSFSVIITVCWCLRTWSNDAAHFILSTRTVHVQVIEPH